LAPLCLLAAPGFCRLWAKDRSYRASLLILCALPALFFFGLATIGRPLAATWDEREPPYQEVAARIAGLTAPGERIFVWGNSPQLYVLARRPMGARFSFCNYMTGESPGTPTETGAGNASANQLPAAWDMLFEDLERRRPALFVDAGAAGWDGYGKYPLARYPRLVAYVEQHYRPVEVRAGVVLYRRDDRKRQPTQGRLPATPNHAQPMVREPRSRQCGSPHQRTAALAPWSRDGLCGRAVPTTRRKTSRIRLPTLSQSNASAISRPRSIRSLWSR
jgi:hypothetical protein